MRQDPRVGCKRACAALAAIVCVVPLGGCTRVSGITPAELVPTLESTGYRFTWRQVGRPAGVEAVVAGRAIDERGTRLDFMVALDDRTHTDPSEPYSLPVVPHSEFGGGAGCGNYGLVTNTQDRTNPAAEERRSAMEYRIERALESRLSGYVCHP